MRHRFQLLFLCALAAFMVNDAFAWGPEGHRITGDIATAYLSVEAKEAIEKILGEQSLADVANWADEARNEAKYEWTRPLHYVNVPRDATSVNMKRDCETGLCIVGAILDFEKKLRDARTSRADRLDALRFLVHFIGDIHQPMHVSYADDLGGNRIDVQLMGEGGTNLHRAWDTGLIRIRMGDAGLRELVEEIQRAITPQLKAQWERSLDPVDWANESLAITRRIYRELPRGGQLGQAYYERNIGDVLQRLAMGGVRMAAMLNDIYAPVPEEGEEPQETPEQIDRRLALAAVALVEGDVCGGGGRFTYIVNRDESRLIEARVRRSWEDRGRAVSHEVTEVVRPGEQHKRRLGCTRQPMGREVREFKWEIVEARFR